jgi:hypothetical protein
MQKGAFSPGEALRSFFGVMRQTVLGASPSSWRTAETFSLAWTEPNQAGTQRKNWRQSMNLVMTKIDGTPFHYLGGREVKDGDMFEMKVPILTMEHPDYLIPQNPGPAEYWVPVCYDRGDPNFFIPTIVTPFGLLTPFEQTEFRWPEKRKAAAQFSEL